tara:strand:- start:272 stop:472 length:201 start_codon:yes stop_codon:yes gene_type:complete
METVKDRSDKVGKALLEKRSKPLSSHINLTQEEIDNLTYNIDSLNHSQKQELIPIIREFAKNHADV